MSTSHMRHADVTEEWDAPINKIEKVCGARNYWWLDCQNALAKPVFGGLAQFNHYTISKLLVWNYCIGEFAVLEHGWSKLESRCTVSLVVFILTTMVWQPCWVHSCLCSSLLDIPKTNCLLKATQTEEQGGAQCNP
jgi:hypothetical protein